MVTNEIKPSQALSCLNTKWKSEVQDTVSASMIRDWYKEWPRLGDIYTWRIS